jgi:hypothetical protein
MTEPIRRPAITYDIVNQVWDNRDVGRFLDECITAIFDVMEDVFDDCEVTADFVHQMLMRKAAQNKISRRGRPRGAKSNTPEENIAPSSLV